MLFVCGILICVIISAGCSYSPPPPDSELTEIFNRNRTDMEEVVDIVATSTTGYYYPPFSPCDSSRQPAGHDLESFYGLTDGQRKRLDGLIARIGCERVFNFNVARNLPSGGCAPAMMRQAAEDSMSVRFLFYASGLSIGGTSKSIIYSPGQYKDPQARWTTDRELNDVLRENGNDTILYKPLADGWFIELEHDN